MKRLLYTYIFKELLGPFFISVMAFTVILLLGKILQLTEMVITRNVSLASVGYLIATILPFVLVFALPMAALLSVLLAFLRLSTDSEITAMKNGGLSLYQLLPPVIVFSLAVYGIATVLSFYSLPWGNYAFRSTLLNLARTKADIAVKESMFNNAFDKVVIYMRTYDSKERLMEDVLISDERDPAITNTIIAPKGYILNNADGDFITLRLYNGTVSRVDNKMNVTQNVSFDRYDVNLAIKGLEQYEPGRKKGTEMSYREMIGAIKEAGPETKRGRAIRIELQKKFVFPFSCLVMAMLGVPLGIQTTQRRRSLAAMWGLFSFLLYYMLLSITLNMGETQHFPIAVGMWAPNALFGLLALYMTIKSANESPIGAIDKAKEWFGALSFKLSRNGS